MSKIKSVRCVDFSYSGRMRGANKMDTGTGGSGNIGGGVAMPAPTIFKQLVVNAGKPERSKR